MPKKQEIPKLRAWRPNIEDHKLMLELKGKLGVNEPAILRMGLRALAEKLARSSSYSLGAPEVRDEIR